MNRKYSTVDVFDEWNSEIQAFFVRLADSAFSRAADEDGVRLGEIRLRHVLCPDGVMAVAEVESVG